MTTMTTIDLDIGAPYGFVDILIEGVGTDDELFIVVTDCEGNQINDNITRHQMQMCETAAWEQIEKEREEARNDF
jgi:hypothetical protein